MKKDKSTEKVIKDVYTNKLRVTTNSSLDERILTNSMNVLEKLKDTRSANLQPGIWRTTARSKIARIAVAAVIIIAACIFFTQEQQIEDNQAQQFIEAAKSPAELTTFAALTFGYRRGGMELVEQMCDRAIEMAGPQPGNISMQELFEENNNGNSERKKL